MEHSSMMPRGVPKLRNLRGVDSHQKPTVCTTPADGTWAEPGATAAKPPTPMKEGLREP